MSNSNIQSSDVAASVREAFNFSIDKFPLSGPDNMKTDQYGLFRSDTGYIKGVKSISSRYVPHSTDDVCALVEAASESLFNGEIECQTHWNRGHYVSVKPTDKQRINIYGTKDNIYPAVIIRGGFDGRGFHGTMGLYRDACRNLEMPRKVSGVNVTIRHTSGLRDRMNYLIDTFGELEQGWVNIVSTVKEMEQKTVNFEKFLANVYADRAPSEQDYERSQLGHNVRSVSVWENRIRKITSRVKKELANTRGQVIDSFDPVGEVSGWMAYNAIQGYVQHDSQSKVGHSSEFAKILRAADDRNVRNAEKFVLSA